MMLTSADSDVVVPDGEIKCMYIDKCTTNSQPRKAISHIFGRNKLCTRLIPNYVWVHYCRKHYQRSRYRNAQEYAKLQCDLVLKQIRRVQAWSDGNKRQNKAGVVQDWSLTVRKREQKRLDDKSAVGKKRRYPDDDMDDLDENENDHAVANGTAVPSGCWTRLRPDIRRRRLKQSSSRYRWRWTRAISPRSRTLRSSRTS